MNINDQSLILFTRHFSKYKEKFIIIGGTACYLHSIIEGKEFGRTTKDIDIVISVFTDNSDFKEDIWHFIKDGDYKKWRKKDGTTTYYRFTSDKIDFPQQLEFFVESDKDIFKNRHIDKLPADLYPLSGIKLEKAYIDLLKGNTVEKNDLNISSILMTIVLKMKAWKELREQKKNGVDHRSDDIKKHKNDVYRLYSLLTEESIIYVSKDIYSEILAIKEELEAEDVVLRDLGLDRFNKTKKEILEEIISKIIVKDGFVV